MRSRGAITIMLLAVGCGQTLAASDEVSPPTRDSGADTGVADDGEAAGDVTVDGGVDAAPPACDHDAPFSPAKALSSLNSPAFDVAPTLTDDELTIVFASRRADTGDAKFYVAKRQTRTLDFDPPELFPIYEVGDNDPMFSGDGRRFFFTSAARAGSEAFDVWVAERASPTGIFGVPFKLGAPNTADNEFQPFPRAGGLWFTSVRNSATRAIYFSALTSGAFTAGTPMKGLDEMGVDDELPVPSSDGLSIYFASKRVTGETNIWFARRAGTADSFATPILVEELNAAKIDAPGWLSPDGCRLYFVRGDNIEIDLFVAEKPPK